MCRYFFVGERTEINEPCRGRCAPSGKDRGEDDGGGFTGVVRSVLPINYPALLLMRERERLHTSFKRFLRTVAGFQFPSLTVGR